MELLIYLAVGILLGLFVLPNRWQKANGKLQSVLMVGALFCTGVMLGSQDGFLTHLAEAGWQSLLIAAATVAGSILLVRPVERFLLRKTEKNEKPDGGEKQ